MKENPTRGLRGRSGTLVALVVLALGANGCALFSQVAAALRVPVASFHGLEVSSVELGAGGIRLELNVELLFRNYSAATLTVPAHTLRLTLGHGDAIQTAVDHAAVTLHAGEEEKIVGYPITLDFAADALQPRVVFGTDAPYSFEIVPQPGLVNSLLSMAGQFSDELPRLRYEDTLRLPLPPDIESVEPASLALLGQPGAPALVPIDLAPIRDGLAGLLGPIVDFGTALLDFLPIEEPERAAAITAWDHFQHVPVEVKLVRVDAISGVRLAVPVRISNPNDFAIRAPALAAGTYLGALALPSPAPANQAIARFRYPGAGIPMLPAHDGTSATPVPTELLMEFRWDHAGSGLAAFLDAGAPSASYIDATLQLDLGYGSLRVPFRAPLPSLELAAP
jgi:hypothetical protein